MKPIKLKSYLKLSFKCTNSKFKFLTNLLQFLTNSKFKFLSYKESLLLKRDKPILNHTIKSFPLKFLD